MSVLGVDLPNLNSSWPLDVSTRGRSGKFELILTTRCQYQGVDLPADLWVVLPNLSFQTFRCGHHRGLFVLHAKDQWTLHLKIRTHFRFGSQYALHLKSWPSCSPHLKMWGGYIWIWTLHLKIWKVDQVVHIILWQPILHMKDLMNNNSLTH